jgi:hypothetical protein
MHGRGRSILSLFLFLGILLLALGPRAQARPLNSQPPATPVRLVFMHHSVGEAWLADDIGNLLQALNANRYYVTDSNYGWGPESPELGEYIGDHTDTGNWYNWFLGSRRDTYLEALYNNLILSVGANTIANPGGPNTVVMFKSCYPNGQGIQGNPDDPPRVSSPADPNPIWGESAGGEHYTVSNIKGLYRDLLAYFATRQDKLFILIATPPSYYESLSAPEAANARAIHTWLTHHWLDAYSYNNVAVFDYFNVLTSNGGDPDTNDLGAATGNHHRLRGGQVEEVIGRNDDFSAYPSGGDSHPTAAGHQKATGEFVPLLNIAYHAWQGDGGRPRFMGRSPAVTLPLGLLLLE